MTTFQFNPASHVHYEGETRFSGIFTRERSQYEPDGQVRALF